MERLLHAIYMLLDEVCKNYVDNMTMEQYRLLATARGAVQDLLSMQRELDSEEEEPLATEAPQFYYNDIYIYSVIGVYMTVIV